MQQCIAFSPPLRKVKPICKSIKFNIAEAAKYGFVWAKNAEGAMTRQSRQTKILSFSQKKTKQNYFLDFWDLHWRRKTKKICVSRSHSNNTWHLFVSFLIPPAPPPPSCDVNFYTHWHENPTDGICCVP